VLDFYKPFLGVDRYRFGSDQMNHTPDHVHDEFTLGFEVVLGSGSLRPPLHDVVAGAAEEGDHDGAGDRSLAAGVPPAGALVYAEILSGLDLTETEPLQG